MNRMTREKAAYEAAAWGDSLDGCALYQFSSLGGRVVSEEHRQQCIRLVQGAALWTFNKRVELVTRDMRPNSIRDLAKLAYLEAYLLSAPVEPLEEVPYA